MKNALEKGSQMVDRVGQQFGNYKLLRKLGTGGFADAYLGEHIHLGSEAAIKVMRDQLSDVDKELFRTEGRNLARLIHPNIVRLLEFGFENNIPYLVMDYAPNGSLREKYPKGTHLPLSTIVHYVKQAAGALQYAHGQKLIHRDVKPENMLLDRNNEVVLSDFGIAVVAHSTNSMRTEDSIGTVSYMAPEQLNKKPRTASDQYALAVVVYSWLTGTLPFTGTFVEIAMQHLTKPVPSLRTLIPTLSIEVERVVLKALNKDPQQRYETILAFSQALEQATSQAFANVPVKKLKGMSKAQLIAAYNSVRNGMITDPTTIRKLAARFDAIANDAEASAAAEFDAARAALNLYVQAQLIEDQVSQMDFSSDFDDLTRPDW